jgi:hypothetical protein
MFDVQFLKLITAIMFYRNLLGHNTMTSVENVVPHPTAAAEYWLHDAKR